MVLSGNMSLLISLNRGLELKISNVLFCSEIRSLFPDEYLHLGVDEVASACWESNPQIQSYLAAKGLENVDLPYMYLERFTANMSTLGWKQMVWQEVNYSMQIYIKYKINRPYI